MGIPSRLKFICITYRRRATSAAMVGLIAGAAILIFSDGAYAQCNGGGRRRGSGDTTYGGPGGGSAYNGPGPNGQGLAAYGDEPGMDGGPGRGSRINPRALQQQMRSMQTQMKQMQKTQQAMLARMEKLSERLARAEGRDDGSNPTRTASAGRKKGAKSRSINRAKPDSTLSSDDLATVAAAERPSRPVRPSDE